MIPRPRFYWAVRRGLNCASGSPFARFFLTLAPAILAALPVRAAESQAPDPQKLPDFRQQIEPLLVQYCYECHGLGEKKGNIAFDELKTDEQLLKNPELWYKALRNVRANIMPPPNHERPTDDEKQLLAQWIKYRGLGIDQQNPDPGRVTIRRLNRIEYRNTIRDLMGFDYKTGEEFPADDTGYGFDNIGDVLTVSPLLLEKYLKAAETIVTSAVATEARTIREALIGGTEMRRFGGNNSLNFYREAKVPFTFTAKDEATYRVVVELAVHGRFEFDPGRCRVTMSTDDHERLNEEYGWNENKKFRYEFEEHWSPGEHQLNLQLEPLVSADKKINSLDLEIVSIKVIGPLEEKLRVPAKGYDRFFAKSEPPADADARRAYARDILSRFATKAFRRPADDETIDRLANSAEAFYSYPDKKFEHGIQQAMIAILASPRFLFRLEGVDPNAQDPHPLLDDYALASRLSYFLWSSMPDDELF